MINDSLGHRIGDLLLCSVAARLKSLLREEDTVARLGGDEFVFIIPYVNRPDMPAHVAQKIIWALTEPHEIEGQDYSIGTSVGISSVGRKSETPSAAWIACYIDTPVQHSVEGASLFRPTVLEALTTL